MAVPRAAAVVAVVEVAVAERDPERLQLADDATSDPRDGTRLTRLVSADDVLGVDLASTKEAAKELAVGEDGDSP